MRLLHTATLQFQEFFDKEIPRYAILSHRWSNSEISFQQLRADESPSGKGYEKIVRCCSLAAERGNGWIWIDTCCIDKTSSAELSEAINSMYKWYKRANECYAYLVDVELSDSEEEYLADMIQSNNEKGYQADITRPVFQKGKMLMRLRKRFRQSEWFTRGWTLQELLAPKKLLFFDRHWKTIGCRARSNEGEQVEWLVDITEATGIQEKYLQNTDGHQHACVAEKMSWISRRKTSRVEDIAYCLLGLFNVNMPLLYGEGKKAFIRLELEIIKQDDDESIFAWTNGILDTWRRVGILATWPDVFATSGDIFVRYSNKFVAEGVDKKDPFETTRPYSMTNRGLELHLFGRNPIWSSEKYFQRVSFNLNCYRRRGRKIIPIKIILGEASDRWARLETGSLEPVFALRNRGSKAWKGTKLWEVQPEARPDDVIYVAQYRADEDE